jgi:transcriptional regulator with PAS, ATPase and Fis domain
VFNKDGEIELVVVNDRDITELNRMRRELEESRALARRYRSGIAIETMKKKLPSDIVIRSESMLLALDMAKSVAEVDSTILIQGESGVGKGVLARYIHQCSKRASSLFVPVNCSAIPESLIESELFGYEEGAFTGARTKGKMGLLEMAEGGTLFLDEVGDLPLTVQVKILRFMEEKVVVRIGSTSPRKLDTRIIAATHRNLNDMVENEKFRKDLYFRLNVVPMVIPPLRERLEDIPALAHFFLSEINRKHSTNKIILPPAIDLICTYSFPGNVRELANLIERLVVLTPQNYIGIDDLPDYVQKDELGVTSCFSGNGLNLNKELARLEKKIITRALKLYGSQRKAAGPLGIDQSTLARKIKKHGTDFDAITHRNDNIH